MSIEHLKVFKVFTNLTSDEIETSTHCSNCQSAAPKICKSSEIGRRLSVCHLRKSARKLRQPVAMFHKFLLIYVLTSAILSPVVCMRHHSTTNDSFSNESTPSTNSILNSKIVLDSDEYDNVEESEEEQNEFTQSPDAIKIMYQKQFNKFSKMIPGDGEKKKNQITTATKPGRTTEDSCSSTVCQARKDVEEASTESIRKHILIKLGMEHEPNKTKYPKLDDAILQRLCRDFNINLEDCLGKKLPNIEYQSDDPNNQRFDDYDSDREVLREEEEDVQYLSTENRIYAFPSTKVKPRHKSHLVFQFTESQQMNNVVSQAFLNIFVHSKRYLRSSDMQLPKNLRFVDIEIGKVLQGSQHKKNFETFRNLSVPDGGNDGDFVQLNVTQMVAEWFLSEETLHGMVIKITASKSGALLTHKIVSLEAENFATRPFIDILLRDQRKKRTKRSSLRCPKGSNESRCCRHELTVDFDKFGWDWIIAPKKYDANYCAGECKIAFMQQYAHTHVMQLSTAANPCCSPRKMTPMQLLYFDSQLNIVLGTIPNMIVEECFCS